MKKVIVSNVNRGIASHGDAATLPKDMIPHKQERIADDSRKEGASSLDGEVMILATPSVNMHTIRGSSIPFGWLITLTTNPKVRTTNMKVRDRRNEVLQPINQTVKLSIGVQTLKTISAENGSRP